MVKLYGYGFLLLLLVFRAHSQTIPNIPKIPKISIFSPIYNPINRGFSPYVDPSTLPNYTLSCTESSPRSFLLSTSASEIKDQPLKVVYPKVVGYMSFIIPILNRTKNGVTNDFANNFQTFAIGFPTGINVLYSEHFGFSYEISPTLQNASTGSKISKISFNPGPMFRFQHGFTLITRLAFETSGRYGFTPVFNQIAMRTKFSNYFIAGSLPVRFGNGEPSSLGLNIQLGLIFN